MNVVHIREHRPLTQEAKPDAHAFFMYEVLFAYNRRDAMCAGRFHAVEVPMGNKPVISKQQILDVAFGLASSSGLSGLSIRDVAQACGISVGTVYNSYPTKADLINDVVGRFWSESLADCMPNALASKNFIEFCRSLSSQIARALKNFQTNWLSEIASLDAHDLISAREREEACFAHVRAGLVVALHADPHINHTRLTGPLDPDALCALIWDSMLASIKGNDPTCETLFALVENTLY